MISSILDQEIKKAMLAKNNAQLRGLRAIKAASLVAKTEKGAAEELSADAELKIIQKLIKQRRESADIYQQQGRADLLEVEQEEIDVISAFLPKQLSKEEVEAVIEDLIKQTGAISVKEMGKVMGLANQQLSGKADGKLIAEVVKEKLS